MFDFDTGKLLIIGIVALIFIPSKDLPRVLRQIGQFVGKMRRMASEFQGQFMEAMREADMAELRKEADKLAKAAEVSVALDPIHDVKTQLTALIDGQPALSASDAETFGNAAEMVAAPDLAVSGNAGAAMIEPAKPSSVTLDEQGIDVSHVDASKSEVADNRVAGSAHETSGNLHTVAHGA